MALNITNQSFDEIINSGKPVLIDFWAKWCGPCKMMTPVIDSLHDEMADNAIVGKINVDEEPEIARKYNIRSIPSILIFKNGEVVESNVGVQTKESLKDSINKFL